MENDHYIEYVRALHGRLSKRASESGLTTWALLGALAYLLLQMPTLLAKLNGIEWHAQVLIQWAHLQTVIETATMLAGALRGRNRLGRFDYRIRLNANSSEAFLACLLIFIIFCVPAALSFSAVYLHPLITPGQMLTLALNKWIFGFFGLVAMIVVLVAYGKLMFTKFPSSIFLENEPSSGIRVFGYFMNVVMVALFSSNLFFFLRPWLVSAQSMPEAVLGMATALTFAIVIIRVLLSSLRLPRSLESLERLERDMIVHNISIDEIRDRLEQEFLGSELGGWLKQGVEEVKRRQQEIQRFSNESKEKIGEIRALDANLKFEKRGRLERLVSTLEEKYQALDNRWTPLARWLKDVRQRPGMDPYVRDLVERTTNDLNEEIARTTSAMKSALENLREAIRDS